MKLSPAPGRNPTEPDPTMTDHEIDPNELAQHAQERRARIGDAVAGLGTLENLTRKYDRAWGESMDDVIARMSPMDRAIADAIRGQLAEFKARRTQEGW